MHLRTRPFSTINSSRKKRPKDLLINLQLKYNYVYTLVTSVANSCNAIRVVSPEVICLYRKCKESLFLDKGSKTLRLFLVGLGVVSPGSVVFLCGSSVGVASPGSEVCF